MNDAGHSLDTAADVEKSGDFLCIGHSGTELSVGVLTGVIEEPDNPIFDHCSNVQIHTNKVGIVLICAGG